MMKSKKAIIAIIFILAIVVVYIILYNKTYHIRVDIDDVYMIQIQTCDSDGFTTKTISDHDEIKAYVDKAKKIRFTHPKFYTGKGWTTMVDINMKNKKGAFRTYRYTISGDSIVIGSFKYDILPD